MKKHIIWLSQEQRQSLQHLIKAGHAPARHILHAHILLKIDASEDGPNWSNKQIHEAFGAVESTVWRVRTRFLQYGVPAAVERQTQPDRPEKRKLTGEQEAHLIALACQAAPEGRERWTLRLLADKLVELEMVESVSHETVRTTLKNELKPWLKEQWCIPPKANAAFVAAMEDVLSVYQRPYDARFPQICLDEISKQLLTEVRDPLPGKPGAIAKQDGEYHREGVRNLFLACEPLTGWRQVQVTERRTRADWAEFVRELVEIHYPQAEKIVLVLDNLNTHTTASLYEAFPPALARRLCEKVEIHYTPKHGSWLNMAEIELSVLSRQCLKQRVGSQPELEHQVTAWQHARNAQVVTVNWRFTTEDARIKLKRLYPSHEL